MEVALDPYWSFEYHKSVNIRNIQTLRPTPDPDFLLLRTDPKGLVLAYQKMVEAIVYKFVRSGMFSVESSADVVQTVNTELLERMPKIQSNYNGSTLVRTYVSAVIRNICLKLHQKRMFGNPLDLPVSDNLLAPGESTDRYSVGQAVKAYWAIMQQFGRDLPKLTICLKLRYHICLEREDILLWDPRCNDDIVSQLLTRFGANAVQLDEKETYAKETYAFVAPIFNAIENKENSPDALRKWTNSRISEIVDILNNSIPTAAFDEDSIRILAEDYFSPFLLKD